MEIYVGRAFLFSFLQKPTGLRLTGRFLGRSCRWLDSGLSGYCLKKGNEKLHLHSLVFFRLLVSVFKPLLYFSTHLIDLDDGQVT